MSPAGLPLAQELNHLQKTADLAENESGEGLLGERCERRQGGRMEEQNRERTASAGTKHERSCKRKSIRKTSILSHSSAFKVRDCSTLVQ